jgi:lipopolysaccharide transport system permease protein
VSADTRREIVIRPPDVTGPSLSRSLRDLADHGDLLYTLTVHRLRVRYKQSLVGIGWAVLQPMATMAVLTVVFAYIARIPTGGVPYALVALAGLVPWTCFANAVTTSTNSIVSHAHLVTKVSFPREILPLTYVLAALVDGAVAAAVLGVLLVAYGVGFVQNLLLALVVVAVLVTLVTGLALLLSASQVRLRDVGVVMPIVLQLLLFASPVAYPLEIVPERLQPYYVLNPLAGILENFRRAVLGTGPAHLPSLAISAAWALVLLPLAYAWFKRVDATAADVV